MIVRTSLLAPGAIVIAMMLFALSDSYVLDISRQMGVWQYHAMRAGLVLPFMIGVILFLGNRLAPRRWAPVLTRACLSISALVIYFAAVPTVSVPLAAAGLFTSPLWVALFSALFYGERAGPRRLLALVLGSIGVALVLGLGSEPLRPLAAMTVLAGAAYGLGIIWTNRYCQQEDAGTLAIWNMIMFLLFGLVGMASIPIQTSLFAGAVDAGFLTMPPAWPDTRGIVLLAGMGIAAGLGMVLLAIGYRAARPTIAAIFDYSFLLWAPLFGWLINSETLSARAAIGMGLIATAGLLALSSGLQRPEEDV